MIDAKTARAALRDAAVMIHTLGGRVDRQAAG